MVYIRKTKYQEIHLEIRASELDTFHQSLAVFQNSKGGLRFDCIYDKSIFSSKHGQVTGTVILRCLNNEQISLEDGVLCLDLDSDSLDLIVDLLEKEIEGKEYMPEICELSIFEKKQEYTLIIVVT